MKPSVRRTQRPKPPSSRSLRRTRKAVVAAARPRGPGARQGIPRCPRSPSSEASPRAARKDAGATCGEWPPCEGSSRAALRLHRAGYLPAQREKLSENAPFVSLRVPGRSGGQAGR